MRKVMLAGFLAVVSFGTSQVGKQGSTQFFPIAPSPGAVQNEGYSPITLQIPRRTLCGGWPRLNSDKRLWAGSFSRPFLISNFYLLVGAGLTTAAKGGAWRVGHLHATREGSAPSGSQGAGVDFLSAQRRVFLLSLF